jgi:hypothetical protein
MTIEPTSIEHQVTIDSRIFLDTLEKTDPASSQPSLDTSLLRLLGCPVSDSGIKYTPPVSIDHQHACGDILPLLLTAIVSRLPAYSSSVSAVLAGINRQNCLYRFLDKPERAYALATGICYYIDTCATSGLDQGVLQDVIELLNKWLKPLDEWMELPSAMEVATKLFGAPWCQLVLPDDVDYPPGSAMWSSTWLLCYVVARERPSFLPGICPLLKANDAIALPLSELDFTL